MTWEEIIGETRANERRKKKFMNNEPEKKIVKFPVWDLETNEIIEMEMDEESYNIMIKSEEEYNIQQEERHKRDDEERWQILEFIKDD